MKDDKRRDESIKARRRFLGLLGGLGAFGIALPLLPPRVEPRERPLKEADFYRPHDLAG